MTNDPIDEVYSSLREKTTLKDTQQEPIIFEDLISSSSLNDTNNDIENINDKFLKPSNILNWGLLDLVQSTPKSNFLNSNDTSSTYNYKDFLEKPNFISRSSYRFKRTGIDGKINNFHETVNLKDIDFANASNSLSLSRPINTNSNAVSGSTSQLPFTPGGISMSVMDGNSITNEISSQSALTKLLHKDKHGLFDIPQGFERGINPISLNEINNTVSDLQELNEIDNEIAVKREILQLNESENINENNQLFDLKNQKSDQDELNEIDELLPVGVDFGRTMATKTQETLKKKEWAHVVDLNHKIENFDELVPNPARTWPFELDTFQKEAVYHLEQGDSVFVAAHTSAGKTVVAEYAIAMSKRNMTKTIYTSPIKALSNQKFRDFRETFEDLDVGLITGDVQINPEANCLIMTTEILRSMLYRGADLIRDVEFVIFDEVHYVNDQDRGVVWEEVIIMLPQHVKFILLSATVPNTFEFATWIGRTKQKNIYVISTPKRPVPLVINIWAKQQLIPVINEKREFQLDKFKQHAAVFETPSKSDSNPKEANSGRAGSSRGGRGGNSQRGGNNQRGRGGNRGGRGSHGAGAIGSNKSSFFRRPGAAGKKTWPELINYLKAKDLLPAVIFVFSKKRCEEYADWLQGVNFCTNKEKSQIHMFIEKSITRLKKEDRELPQILKIRELLSRGIAVHHGGLLPIVKELIEILFAKGLIRVLFATETFAMGLNLPTRTVVFSEIRKHDGKGQRFLTPGEFTQMAGRAGRRGLDKTGTVIIMTYNEPFKSAEFKEVTLGVPTKLESQFRLTYNMILNLLRIEALRVEEMIKYSFSENLNQHQLPENEKKIIQLKEDITKVEPIPCDTCDSDIKTFLDLAVKYRDTSNKMLEELAKSPNFFRILRVGRLLVYRDSDKNIKIGFFYKHNLSNNNITVACVSKPQPLQNKQPNYLPYIGDMKSYTQNAFSKFKPCNLEFETVPLGAIEMISAYTLRVQFTDLLDGDEKAMTDLEQERNKILRVSNFLKETSAEKKSSIMVYKYQAERENIKEDIKKLKCISCPKLKEHFVPFYNIYQLEKEIENLSHLISEQNLNLLPDYESRLAVLKDTDFINDNQNVLLKGRVACEISTGYELVLTELILDNFLGDFEPEEIVALLSVFIYEGRTREEEPAVPTPRLTKGKKKIQEIYSKMLQVYEKHQVTLTQEEAEFLEQKRFALMNVVYEWARGLSFKEIMQISVEQEGTVVRVITRLDEICRQVKTAAVIIGNSNLHTKMTQAQELIKRDIVFAASLYL